MHSGWTKWVTNRVAHLIQPSGGFRQHCCCATRPDMTFATASPPPPVSVCAFGKFFVILGLVPALLGAGCGSGATTTSPSSTPTTPVAPAVTERFVGTLAVGGARFYSFSISAYGTVNATLVSIGGSGIPPTVEVNLGIGTPSGSTCSSTPPPVQVSGDAGVTTLVTAAEQPGVYCVIISDLGNLSGPANFTVTIDHP
jgi:hypothetical protein